MSDTRRSTKLFIPHNLEACTLVGVLEQVYPEQPTQGRKIALILHGTMGHKDYLFQKRLAQRLPFDSFRFDFRGNHESDGSWKYYGFAEDTEDIAVVVAHLRNTYGYEIDMVVGHSRGSVAAMHWICTSEEGKHMSAFVNASGRYRMQRIKDTTAAWKSDFDTKGYHEWKTTVARKEVARNVTSDDVERFTKWNSAIVWERFPPTIDVFTIHGLDDKTVPPYDALIYARVFGKRSDGTHTLHLIEGADHNFTGRQDEIVDCVLDWWNARSLGNLETGIWLTGVKGKL